MNHGRTLQKNNHQLLTNNTPTKNGRPFGANPGRRSLSLPRPRRAKNGVVVGAVREPPWADGFVGRATCFPPLVIPQNFKCGVPWLASGTPRSNRADYIAIETRGCSLASSLSNHGTPRIDFLDHHADSIAPRVLKSRNRKRNTKHYWPVAGVLAVVAILVLTP